METPPDVMTPSSGWILMKNMSDNFLKNWQPMFPPDKLVKMFVLQTDPKVGVAWFVSVNLFFNYVVNNWH